MPLSDGRRSREPDRIRVLFCSSFAERGRGGQESLFHLACGLDSRRFHARVLVPAEGSLAQSLRRQGVAVHALDLPRVAWRSGPEIAAALRRLLQLVDRWAVDLLHTDGPRNTFYAALAGKLRRKPVVWHVRASTSDPYDPLLSRLSSRMLLVADALRSRFPSPAARRKIRVIPNGVDLNRFRPAEERSAEESRSGKENLLIGTVGRVEQEKGTLVLLEAFRHLHATGTKLRLRVAGASPDPAYARRCRDFCLEAGIGDRVEFLGHVHPAENFLRTLDVFVLPSVAAEAFSRAVLEAMACGKPVVATAVGGVSEAVEEGRTGFLVPPGEPAALADRLRRLTQNVELRRRMGRLGRQRVERCFGLDRNTALTQRVYEELLRG